MGREKMPDNEKVSTAFLILIESHVDEGQKRYGSRWDDANIGWSSGEGFISSKVYGEDPKIFTTYLEDNKCVHKEEDY